MGIGTRTPEAIPSLSDSRSVNLAIPARSAYWFSRATLPFVAGNIFFDADAGRLNDTVKASESRTCFIIGFFLLCVTI
jgi:hypothetical protein